MYNLLSREIHLRCSWASISLHSGFLVGMEDERWSRLRFYCFKCCWCLSFLRLLLFLRVCCCCLLFVVIRISSFRFSGSALFLIFFMMPQSALVHIKRLYARDAHEKEAMGASVVFDWNNTNCNCFDAAKCVWRIYFGHVQFDCTKLNIQHPFMQFQPFGMFRLDWEAN